MDDVYKYKLKPTLVQYGKDCSGCLGFANVCMWGGEEGMDGYEDLEVMILELENQPLLSVEYSWSVLAHLVVLCRCYV